VAQALVLAASTLVSTLGAPDSNSPIDYIPQSSVKKPASTILPG
jgi:hypothetical protein